MFYRIVTLLSLAFTLVNSQTYDGSTTLHYTTPADSYDSSLPIGNGRMGLTMYGSAVENLVLNEDSVWSGNFDLRVDPDAKSTWQNVRQQFADNQYENATNTALRYMVPNPDQPKAYSVSGTLSVDLGQDQNGFQDYTRWLDTISGLTGANYTYTQSGQPDAHISRLAVASYPDNVMVMRISSDQEFDATLSLTRSINIFNQTADVSNGVNSLVTFSGSDSSPGGLDFAMQARAVIDQGSATADGSNLKVSGVKTLDIFIDIESTYRYDDYKGQTDSVLNAAVSKGFDAIRSDAVTDHANLMNTVSLNFGNSEDQSLTQNTTDQRLYAYRESPQNDVQLMTTLYNYGRHLLIGSSRISDNKALPANLQGLWCIDTSPAWGGRFTVNINLEMNYWSVGAGNIASQTEISLFDLLDLSRVTGAQMAKEMYGIEKGIVMHHNLDLWADAGTCNNGSEYTIWPMSAPWLATHYLENYRYTGDKTLLQDRALPYLNDVAAFYEEYLWEYEGSLVTGPSCSPENDYYIPSDGDDPGQQTGMDIAPAMDMQMLYQMYTDIQEAYSILGDPDNENAANAKSMQSKLFPNQIGSFGQILEYRDEYSIAIPGMRHLSPIWALYPGKEFTPLVNQTLATAAKVLLDDRMKNGSGNTGWSRAWVTVCYARLLDGQTSWNNAVYFIQKFLSTNMWNTDSGPGSPFQIDGNFGIISAIQEMILQSHANLVHLLPALSPDAAQQAGSVTGLQARQGFSVDIEWNSGATLKQAVITSNQGNELAIQLVNGTSFLVDGNAYNGPFSTNSGQKYTITPS